MRVLIGKHILHFSYRNNLCACCAARRYLVHQHRVPLLSHTQDKPIDRQPSWNRLYTAYRRYGIYTFDLAYTLQNIIFSGLSMRVSLQLS